MSLRALIFDFDGTIAETERDGHRVAYNAAFTDLGLGWTWDEAKYGDLLAVAGGRERILHYIATEHASVPLAEREDLAARLHAQKIGRFAELAPHLVLRPGFLRLVAEAKASGLLLAIATTANERGVRDVLATYPETLAAFDVIAAGDVVPRKKPSPDVYLYALGKLGVDASEAVAFEDSAIGLASAVAAGIATVVTPSIYTANENFDGATAVVSSLDATDGGGPITVSALRSLLTAR